MPTMRHVTPGMISHKTSLIAAKQGAFHGPKRRAVLVLFFFLKTDVIFIMLVKGLQYLNGFKLKRVGLD